MYTEDAQWTVTVKPDFVLELLETTVVLKDGTPISSLNWRTTAAPGDDVSAYPDNVKAIAATVWTPEVVAEWKAKVKEAKDALPKA